MTHTGEKPFQCEHCDFRSNRKFNLDSHKKTVHKDFSGMVISCEICGRGFSNESSLKCHITAFHNRKSNGKEFKKAPAKQQPKLIKLPTKVETGIITQPVVQQVVQHHVTADQIHHQHQELVLEAPTNIVWKHAALVKAQPDTLEEHQQSQS